MIDATRKLIEDLENERWHAAHLLSDHVNGALSSNPEEITELRAEIAELDAKLFALKGD